MEVTKDDDDLSMKMQRQYYDSKEEPSTKWENLSRFAKKKTKGKGNAGKAMVCMDSTSTSGAQDQESGKIRFDAVNNIPIVKSAVILGDIIEHKFDSAQMDRFDRKVSSKRESSMTCSPKAEQKSESQKSLFLQELEKECEIKIETPMMEEIHKSNIHKIQSMSAKEIEEAKAELEKMFPPATLEFLKSRRKREHEVKKEKNQSKHRKIEDDEKMEVEVEMPVALQEIFEKAKEKEWKNMNKPEPDKLKWTEDLPPSKENENSDAKEYNARFDFNGILMPFKDDSVTVDEGLHHHGEEPERPGYSLQELIQLSRSENQQQRCIALSTIANIFSRTRAGFYDRVLHPAPLSMLNEKNIFMLLRFSLDDTAVPVVTAALRAMKEFLVSQPDEFCLDRLFGLVDNYVEPTLNVKWESDENLEELNDEQLGQIDTIRLAIKSKIVERIRYILNVMQPPPAGVDAALEILIRIARTETGIVSILKTPELIETIVKNFAPLSNSRLLSTSEKDNAYGLPMVNALRFFRILMVYKPRSIMVKLRGSNIIHSMISYISSDVGVKGLDLKIESLRLWSIILSHQVAMDSVSGTMSMLFTQIELVGNNLDLMTASEKACEEASALILVARTGNHLKESLRKLLRKWSTQLGYLENPTWAQTKLISQTIIAVQSTATMQTKWTANPNIFSNLKSSSNLLSSLSSSPDRDPKSLPSLGVVMENGDLQPIISKNSIFPFLTITLNYFLTFNHMENDAVWNIFENLTPYLRDLVKYKWNLTNSWYTRPELLFLTKVVEAAKVLKPKTSNNESIWKISLKLISALPKDRYEEWKVALNYALSSENLMTDLVSGHLGSLRIEQDSGFSVSSDFTKNYEQFVLKRYDDDWRESMMPQDWIYLPIVNAYEKMRTMEEKKDVVEFEKDIQNVKVMLFLESTVPQLVAQLTPNIRFSRLCLVFMIEQIYSDETVTSILIKAFSSFLGNYHKKLNLSISIPGLSSFTDLFTELCEHYLAHSYGKDHFSIVMLVFAAQRHDVHYRKLLWSEHSGALRFLAVAPENLYFPLTEFLYPLETDVSLIETYSKALIRKTVRPTWCPVPYIIAVHHVAMFMKQETEIAKNIRNAAKNLEDKELSEMLLNYQSPIET